MKVYHGTTFNRFTEITINGIAPREDKKTNWPDNPSMSDMVYLTTAYPFYFAYIAAQKDGSKPVVIEIDMGHLPYQNLFPDEDFIFQAIPKEEKPELALIRQHIEDYKKYFQKSMDGLGSFCYRGVIPRKYMIRAVSVDFKKRSRLWMEVMDPTISIMNYQLVGHNYRDMVSWFFGDREELPGVDRSLQWVEHAPEETKKGMENAVEFWKKESKNRDGIAIIHL